MFNDGPRGGMDVRIRESERDTEIHKKAGTREREICKRPHAQGDLSPTHQITHTSRSGRSGFSITSVRDCTQKSTPYAHCMNNFYARTHAGAHIRRNVNALGTCTK